MSAAEQAPVPTGSLLPAEVEAELAALVAAGQELRAGRHAELTRKAYQSDFAHFTDWCNSRALAALPADPRAVWLYLTAMVEADNAADYRVATLERRLSAIKWVHEANGRPSPTTHTEIRELMAGIRRRFGTRPDKVDPLSTDQVARLIATLDLNTLSGLRDRALLLFGFAGAFRRCSNTPGVDTSSCPTAGRPPTAWCSCSRPTTTQCASTSCATIAEHGDTSSPSKPALPTSRGMAAE